MPQSVGFHKIHPHTGHWQLQPETAANICEAPAAGGYRLRELDLSCNTLCTTETAMGTRMYNRGPVEVLIEMMHEGALERLLLQGCSLGTWGGPIFPDGNVWLWVVPTAYQPCWQCTAQW